MSGRELDVCVVGAGPVGAALACLLATRGVETAIVDRQALPPMEHPDFDGRAYAIAAGSRAGLLEPAGIWRNLTQAPCPIEGIRVSDGKLGRPASPLFLHFDMNEAGGEADDADGAGGSGGGVPFGHMVEARSLRCALNATLHAMPGLRVHAPATVARGASIADDTTADGRATLVLDDGTLLRPRLVVAAEGRESPLRRDAGITVTRHTYKQSGIVAAIAHEKPHGNQALEHFLPAGPFAQLPMAPIEGADFVSAIVWTEESALARRLVDASDAVFVHEVQRRLGSHLGAVRLIGRRWLYPLSAMHAHRYVGERLALVGDAAHGIHPIAGQGLNLGFRDAICLGAMVADAVRDGVDPGAPALLARYQAARRPDDMLMLAATDLLDRLFSSDNRLLRIARDIGIASVDRAGPIKRLFMQRAMGLGGGGAPSGVRDKAAPDLVPSTGMPP